MNSCDIPGIIHECWGYSPEHYLFTFSRVWSVLYSSLFLSSFACSFCYYATGSPFSSVNLPLTFRHWSDLLLYLQTSWGGSSEFSGHLSTLPHSQIFLAQFFLMLLSFNFILFLKASLASCLFHILMSFHLFQKHAVSLLFFPVSSTYSFASFSSF